MPTSSFVALVQRAALRFRPAGRGPYHFAQGKLGRDPAFAALLRQGLIPSNARLVDLGCGQGVLMALLAEAQRGVDGWPSSWAPLPRGLAMRGVDLRADAVAAGAVALGACARIEHGDIRSFEIPPCDVITILDVLHYVDAAAQEAVIARCAAALADGGKLLLRVGDASRGWAFRFTLLCDWLVTVARGGWNPRFHCRTLDGWKRLLERHGFAVQAQPMSQGTPFANALLVAQRVRPQQA